MIEPKRSIHCEIKKNTIKYYPARQTNARLHVNNGIFKHLRQNKRFLAKSET